MNEENLKTWPEKVWLQGCDTEDLLDYPGSADVSWCAEQVFGGDTEYTRSDLFPTWVSIEDSLPEPGAEDLVVLCPFTAAACYKVKNPYREGTDWHYDPAGTNPIFGVTHWLKLPKFPEELGK